MTQEDKDVNGLGVVNSIKEPPFFDQISGFDDFGNVGIARKIIQDSECHDAQTCERWLLGKVD